MKVTKYLTILSSAIMFSCTPVPALAQVTCEDIGHMAYDIMKRRQENFSMQILMKFKASIKNKEAQEYHTMLVRAAYREPLYMTDENKHRKIVEFHNMAFMACLDYEQFQQIKK